MTRSIALVRDDPYTPIIADFRATMTHLKCAMSERVLRAGISMGQLHILFALQRTGDMTMTQLADHLAVSLSNATGIVDRIEERGYVERQRVPEDRRVVSIRVTAAGSRLLDEVDALNDELLRSVLSRIDPSQLEAVGAAFSALRVGVADAIDAAGDHPATMPSTNEA